MKQSRGSSISGREKGSLKEMIKTKTVPASKNPWFDEENEVILKDSFQCFEVCVHSKTLLKDKLLGRIIFPKYSLELDNKCHEEWYQIISAEESSENPKTKTHDFQSIKHSTPQQCGKCRTIIWGLQNNSFKWYLLLFNISTFCGIICHSKCYTQIKSACGISGSIRIKYLYTEEFILPLTSYSKLMSSLLSSSDFCLILALGEVTDEREEVARNIMGILDSANEAVRFLKAIATFEIQSTSDPNTIFRANSLGSKAVDQYMKRVGKKYLKKVLEGVIKEINIQNRPCELDPTRIKENENKEENFTVLEAYIKWTIDEIFQSTKDCPVQLKQVFRCMHQEAMKKFPEDKVVPYTVVTAFLFLRFFNAAILGPKLFDLIPRDSEPPNAKNSRTLTLISKTIQQLANMTPFDGRKEPYMSQLNHLVEQNTTKLKQFIEDICKEPKKKEDPLKRSNEASLFKRLFGSKNAEVSIEDDVELQLAYIHRSLQKNFEKMKQKSKEKDQEEFNHLKQVLDELQSLYDSKSVEIAQEKENALKNLEKLSIASSVPVIAE